MADPYVNKNDATEILTMGPFGGLDPTTVPYRVSPANFVDIQNFVPNANYGGFISAPGRTVFSDGLPSIPNGIGCLQRPGVPDLYLYAVDNGAVGQIWIGPKGGPNTQLTTPTPLSPGRRSFFVPCQEWVFFTNGLDNPLKIDTNLVVTNWGITAPATAPALIAAGVSTMSGTYNYTITFVGSNGQESSEGLISPDITVTDMGIALTAIPVSTDPQVTARRIYRIGGALGTWLEVATLNDNTTTTYLDTTSDDTLSGNAVLTPRRDPPPPFSFICVHQERMWGFGIPGDANLLYYSNFDEPWGFNADTGTLPVGENGLGDGATGLVSTGSVLVCNKRRREYQVVGSTPDEFDAILVATTGCLAPPASAYGLASWVGNQGIFMADGGSSPQNISDGQYQASNVKAILNTMTVADKEAACVFVYDRMWHYSFPTKQLTLLFDMRSNAWFKLSWYTSQAYFDLESDTPLIGANINIIARGQIDQWYAAPTDLGQPVEARVLSRISDGGDIRRTKMARYLHILAPEQDAVCYLRVICNPGEGEIAFPLQPLDLSRGGPRHQLSVEALNGALFQVELRTVASTPVLVDQVSLYALMRGYFRPDGAYTGVE